jgi:hypothetical protein
MEVWKPGQKSQKKTSMREIGQGGKDSRNFFFCFQSFPGFHIFCYVPLIKKEKDVTKTSREQNRRIADRRVEELFE